MKFVDEYRDSSLVKPLVGELQTAVTRPTRIMEVCGTHTMAIFRNGIRSILPEGLEIVSGPGCPVCVTGYKTVEKTVLRSTMVPEQRTE